MAVIVGSARIDENGKAIGGKAGDQKGNECSTQSYYLHSKGWRVLRAIDPEHRKRLADCMRWACANNRIGYDQGERNTLYNEAKKFDFDVRKVDKNVETDCSALVRVCIAYACGITDLPASMRTTNMCSLILATGAFVELKESKYTTQSAYLGAGDILCTKTQGHTVIVLTNGSKYEVSATTVVSTDAFGDRLLRNGDEGEDVKTLQQYLIKLGFDCGSWGADGEFGDCTELAVRNYQRSTGHLEVDGEVGEMTYKSILADIESLKTEGGRIEIVGGDCFVRAAPKTTASKLGVAHCGDKLQYQGQDDNGWHLVEYKGENGWVSGKYSKVIE